MLNGMKRNPDGSVTVRFYEIIDDLPAFADGGLVQAAHAVRGAGRWGDEILLHVNPEEFAQLQQMWGEPTLNPHTGLPEYGFLSKLWKKVKKILPVAAMFIPGVGPAIGAALGATGTAASVIGNAVLGGVTGGIANGGKGALVGALTGGLGGFGAAGKLGSALGLSGNTANIVGQGLIGGGISSLSGGDFGEGALGGALGAFTSPLIQKLTNSAGISGLGSSSGDSVPGLSEVEVTARPMSASSVADPSAGLGSIASLASIPSGLQDLDFTSSLQNNVQQAPNSYIGPISDGTPNGNRLDPRAGSAPATGGLSGEPDAIDFSNMIEGVSPDKLANLPGVEIPEINQPTFLQGLQGEVQNMGQGLLQYAKENPLQATLGALSLIQNVASKADQPSNPAATGVTGTSTKLDPYPYNRRYVGLGDPESYYTYGQRGGGHRWFDYSNPAPAAPPTVTTQPPDMLFGMARGGALNYVRRGTGAPGRADNINAKLSENEYVVDAETVALLGDGNPDAGAAKLDKMRSNIRRHKGRALMHGKISPDAGDPMHYMGH